MTLFSDRARERKKLAYACAPVLCRIIAVSALVVFSWPAWTAPANAQTEPLEIPPVTVTAPLASPSLTVPSPDEASETIQRTPGGVDLVPAEEFRETRAVTLKDVLDYVPGVFAQPKWGEDARLSIRGSGIARNFHLRGVRLLQDGIPTVKADGSGDFQELDPLAARYVEVYRGANALRYGSTMLGGAIRPARLPRRLRVRRGLHLSRRPQHHGREVHREHECDSGCIADQRAV